MEKLDYKKKYKDLYQPGREPSVIEVPEMVFITVKGEGDPNTCPEYKAALEMLYGLSFTIKMSKMNNTQPEGYFEYTVPPLEGLWHCGGDFFDGMNIKDKDSFKWVSMIRQPEFVTEEVFLRARETLAKKKPELDLNKAGLIKYTEGLCVQVMHIGSYDNEGESILKLKAYAEEKGYREDFSDRRLHHEIYLSDPRRCAAEKLRTVIRHPIAKL